MMQKNKISKYWQVLPIFVFFLIISGLHSNSQAQDTTYYFYQALPYGSQANYDPFNVIINGGYGVLQIPNYTDRRIFEYPYRSWWKDLWCDIGNPVNTIDQFGWKRFLSTEIFPTSLNIEKQQFFPNYFLHTLGAGMHYRATMEWYRHHRFPHPALSSVVSMTAYHLLSEMVENRNNKLTTVDAIADLYFFDPLGIALFSNEKVCRFFSQKLELAEWSNQPAYNFNSRNLENMGQFYVMKYPLTSDKRWKAFSHFGLNAVAGLSRKIDQERSLSLGLGFTVKELTPAQEDQVGRALTARLALRAGAFYDINNSLMCSVVLSEIPESRFRMNVYPGLLKYKGITPGLFLSQEASRGWVAGIKLQYLPLGAAF
ncbi:MAG: hypothetical protein KKG02_02980 [Candidatus Edwardsbacteria bacterium]|nr:hypothetical protein [Candidatus Edwardsbacteria bacterium]